MTVAPYDFPKAHDYDVNTGGTVALPNDAILKATTVRARNSYCTGWMPRDYSASPYDVATDIVIPDTSSLLDIGQIEILDASSFDLAAGNIRTSINLYDQGSLIVRGNTFSIDGSPIADGALPYVVPFSTGIAQRLIGYFRYLDPMNFLIVSHSDQASITLILLSDQQGGGG